MYDPRIDDLVQKELDGTLAGSERTALEDATERDPEVVEQRDLMKAIGATLDDLPRVDPPPGFVRAVMENLGAPKSRGSNVVRIDSWSRRRALFAAGGVAAAALVALLFLPYISQSIDNNHAGGAMVKPGTAPVEIIDLAPHGGALRVVETPTRVTFRIDARPGDALELEFDAEAFASATVSGAEIVRQESGAVAVSLRGGPANVALERRSAGATAVGVTFSGRDGTVVKRTVNVPPTTNL